MTPTTATTVSADIFTRLGGVNSALSHWTTYCSHYTRGVDLGSLFRKNICLSDLTLDREWCAGGCFDAAALPIKKHYPQ